MPKIVEGSELYDELKSVIEAEGLNVGDLTLRELVEAGAFLWDDLNATEHIAAVSAFNNVQRVIDEVKARKQS